MKYSHYNRSEAKEITRLFNDVFSDSEGPSEGALIEKLVLDITNTTEEKDVYGFVAEEGEQLIGSIFFTRLTFDALIKAFILSPVAVHLEHQGKGVGQNLINHGLE
ncbi:MAG: GNAT family N-acetyltransferase [Calditrichota bacterium]